MPSPTDLTRRDFVSTMGLLAAGAAGAAASASAARAGQPAAAMRPVALASGNGLNAVARARELLLAGADPLDAAVEGVRLVEDDPNDHSVGLGGLPNEEGVVELDSSVMHGPTHRAGAVAALRNIRNPAAVAREVARRTDHVLLVGEGALKFALRMGFKEENLLTEEAREMWLKWKASLNRDDDWLEADEFDIPARAPEKQGGPRGERPAHAADSALASGPRPQAGGSSDSHLVLDPHGVWHTDGTIHLSAVTAGGDLAGCTTTSGLSWKLPGRVGDSPIIGSGCYTDNAVGSAGGTGRGEAAMQNAAAFHVVRRMEAGDDPTAACLHVLRCVAERTRAKRLLDAKGRPNFNLSLYALRKDGAFGGACLLPGGSFAVADDRGARVEPCAVLFPGA